MNEKNLTQLDVNWDDLSLFLCVGREGGLSPASRAVGRSPATLGRRMLALERTMQRTLFVRHDRGYTLTEDGRRLMDDLSAIEQRVLRLATPLGTSKMPMVSISAGTWSTLALMERLDVLAGSPADVGLRFVSAERQLNIGRREISIGLRNRRPTQLGLAGRKLNPVSYCGYKVDGAPDRWIKVLADTPSAQWLAREVGEDAAFEVTAPRNALDLALAGLGIALLPTFVGDKQSLLRRTGDLVHTLTHDQWLVTHDDDRQLPHVRRTLDRMAAVLMPGERVEGLV